MYLQVNSNMYLDVHDILRNNFPKLNFLQWKFRILEIAQQQLTNSTFSKMTRTEEEQATISDNLFGLKLLLCLPPSKVFT